MNTVSLWAARAIKDLSADKPSVFSKRFNDYEICSYLTDDSFWITVALDKDVKMSFRTAYSPDELVLSDVKEIDGCISVTLSSSIGRFIVDVRFPGQKRTLLRYTVSFQARTDVFIPFWPRDILIMEDGRQSKAGGNIHVSQEGLRSGIIYASRQQPAGGSFLYLQNFTALDDYFKTTRTSAANTVGGKWPELGFALPAAADKPFPAKQRLTISDAFVVFDPQVPDDQFAVSKLFMDLLADIYVHLPRPKTTYIDHPDILHKSLSDLESYEGCWVAHGGNAYLNAYISDYKNPPESMVQLAVLLPLLDYAQWKGQYFPMIGKIKEGLRAFHDEDAGILRRWLPSVENMLDGSEPHKKPEVMDSWYMYHPLLNLSRMALQGDDLARDLFLRSLEYSIKVAHHFDYRWPVFYDINTLEVIKAEAAPGKGGETDVAGLYAHVMLQAWEITGDQRYLQEAETAAQSMTQYGFDVLYQANNTAFSAGAMLRLYKATKNELYLDLSYLFLANLFKNMALWQCSYGHLRNFPLFFALFPLTDAPYLAVYEEQECFAAFHDYLRHADDVPILRSVSLLLAEFIKYLIARSPYYYPPLLPKEMLSEEVRTGELAPDRWIVLEDIHDGWDQSGEVGQEVYGAGLSFGIVPRHYLRAPGADFMVFVEYPVSAYTPGSPLRFKVLGDKTLQCRIRIIRTGEKPLPPFTVKAGAAQQTGRVTIEGHLEYIVHGDQIIEINQQP